ncbi:MAG: hypothetical protein JNK18_14280 [Cyclobacteriaceae bacterium]|nr:hypothetical protein [Cyclobacteriaceae bacterium]
MTDNIGEQHPDGTTNISSGNLSSESATTTEPRVFKKQWGEYLLQFIMLFLAVFLGFVAENIRENNIDKETERVYMQNMLYDLQADTTIYSDYFSRTAVIYDLVDTIAVLIKKPARERNTSKLVYSARILTAKWRQITLVTRTYEEMKSSGHLRLIQNKEISGKVSSYYNSLAVLDTYNNVGVIWSNNYAQAMAKLFDGAALLEIIKKKKKINLPDEAMISEDKIAINQLLTSAGYFYGAISLSNDVAANKKKDAQQLIELIKKEYNLE